MSRLIDRPGAQRTGFGIIPGRNEVTGGAANTPVAAHFRRLARRLPQ